MDAPSTVIGSGSWGTALAALLAREGRPVCVWDADPAVLRDIRDNGRNARYLPDFALPASVTARDALPAALEGARLIVFAVPACAVEQAARAARPHIPPEVTLVSATKGLCPHTGRRMSEAVSTGADVPPERVVALSGPNLAREVCAGVPTAAVAAGLVRERMEEVRAAFSGPSFRVYTNPDITGVELGGALKNVIAIGAGINDGLGFGDNTKATVLTRGLAEMTRIGIALGARPETLRGLSGLGDLIATSVSPKSRNYRVGLGLGQGRRLEEILEELGQVAEGVPTARAARDLARRLGVQAPLADVICAVLFDGLEPLRAVEALMSRAHRDELLDEPCAPPAEGPHSGVRGVDTAI